MGRPSRCFSHVLDYNHQVCIRLFNHFAQDLPGDAVRMFAASCICFNGTFPMIRCLPPDEFGARVTEVTYLWMRAKKNFRREAASA